MKYAQTHGDLRLTTILLKTSSDIIKICFFSRRFGSFPMTENMKNALISLASTRRHFTALRYT